jgi:quinol monooxygenase YgiN
MKYIMARYTVRPEAVKQVKKAISEFIAEVHHHEPRTFYAVFRENGQHTFVHLMRFENEEAERRHSRSKYNDRFVKKLLSSCVGKPTFVDYRFFAASKQHWSLNPVR